MKNSLLIACLCVMTVSGVALGQTLPVFTDGYASGVSFADFGGATNALTVDATTFHAGTSSLKIAVPAAGYTGGAMVAATNQNLTTYNAVTFWAKASVAHSLDVVGFGNNAAGVVTYVAEWGGVALTTTWTKYVVPIPMASMLTAQTGVFHFAEGAEAAGAYSIWIDDIQYENLTGGVIGAASPAIATETVNKAVGDPAFGINGASVVFPVNSVNQVIAASRDYFTWTSSLPSVATIDVHGMVTTVAAGTTLITAKLGTISAAGTTTVVVTAPLVGPTTVATAPTRPAANVIALFSSAYTNRTIDTWRTSWTPAGAVLTDPYTIPGSSPAHNVKKYQFSPSDNYAGIEFIGTAGANEIDATGMTHFHVDIWTPDVTNFQVKLVDFGADKGFGGGDDTDALFTATAGSVPSLGTKSTWVSLDIPLASFLPSGASWNKAHLAQAVLVVPLGGTVYLDHIYFYNSGTAADPTVAAPTPTLAASDVISLFSNAYTNVPVDTWSAPWDNADVADVKIASNDTKKYTNLTFAGIEFTSTTVNATSMSFFHMNIWTPDQTTTAAFKIKLVDFGANGTYAGGDDVEHELTLTAATTPALATGGWLNLNIPLTNFTGLTTKAHVAQLIISGDLKTVFVDNVYFSKLATDVTEHNGYVPSEYVLGQNYPNPFNPSTQISYSIPKAGMVSLNVHDVMGREVMSLVNGYQAAGSYTATLHTAGLNLASGIYFYRLQSGSFTAIKKLVLMK